MKKPVKVAVSGAAGQIGYALIFRIAAGEMLGPDQPVILHLLEIPQALEALEGIVMELHDCAFPLLQDIHISDQAEQAFAGVDYALLVGARPRGPGMERKDLLTANSKIFSHQGEALNRVATDSTRVLVVGNPANTNAWVAKHHAADMSPHQFSAMTRLDHNRACAAVAQKLNVLVREIDRVTIWGNHSATQYPDLHHAKVSKQDVMPMISQTWYVDEFIPSVQQRGTAVIKARGASSAASAANAAMAHMHDWVLGHGDVSWTSMAVFSDGSYGIPEGLCYSFPVTCHGGQYEIVQDLAINDFSRRQMDITVEEMQQEIAAVSG